VGFGNLGDRPTQEDIAAIGDLLRRRALAESGYGRWRAWRHRPVAALPPRPGAV